MIIVEGKMYKDLTVNNFMSTLSSDSPVPGGGSVAAMAGATASNLIAMVASLTIDKKGYEDSWELMKHIKVELEDKGMEFLNAIDEDALSYAKVIDSFKLPKNTDGEKADRSEAIQSAMIEAAKTPLNIAEKASTLFDYAKLVIEKGNKNAATDGAVGALMARTCVLGALYNVKINAISIKDETIRADLLNKAKALEELAISNEAEVLKMLSF